MKRKQTDIRHAAAAMAARRDARTLMQVALGREKADLEIINARVVNVYSGEIIDDGRIAIKGEWIAAVGNLEPDRPPAGRVIDAAGRTVIPGLIDAHTHLAWYYTIERFLPYAMADGTTTIVTETMEIYPVTGKAGLLAFLDSLRDQPVKLLATAPANVSISRRTDGMAAETLRELVRRPDILGLGETYWQALLQTPDALLENFQATLRTAKTLEGHSAGARGARLSAYAASGISSCHEPIDADQAAERLRLGLYVMIREGSIRRDLAAIAGIRHRLADSRRLILVTDGVSPGDLISKGYMRPVVQKAIDCGWGPVAAVQMATLNPATHFGLESVIGGIAPGRQADLVVIPDPYTIAPDTVISRGRVIVENGRVRAVPRQNVYPRVCCQTVKLTREMRAADFEVRADGDRAVTVRVMEMVTDLVTRAAHVAMQPSGGVLLSDTAADILKVAAIDRSGVSGKRSVGFIRGFGLKAGALACSAAWDSSDIVVVGADAADMAQVVNRIARLGGGAVAGAQGEILAEVPMPLFGILSPEPMPVLADQLAAFNKTAAQLGAPFADPLLTLVTLTGAAIPFLRICEEGLVDLKAGRSVPLLVD